MGCCHLGGGQNWTTANPSQWGSLNWGFFPWTALVAPQQFTIAQFTYNTCTAPHRPCSYTDAAGQTTKYTYNAFGQLTSVTNPLGQKTTHNYDSSRNLTTIVNANNQTAATFTYDAFDRVATYTDSEGWIATYNYDAADRVTKITYPDGTASVYTYDKLDLASLTDRLGRTWTYTHDADRRLTQITDPLGHNTMLGYDQSGRLTSLTDPNGNTTSWAYDVQGRLTTKTYPDGKTTTYAYDSASGRLASVTDALGQIKSCTYTLDNRVASITSSKTVNPTPNVSFTYDDYFPRVASMTDGTGTTTYSYVAPGSLGALRLYQETSPLAYSTITYGYDQLGRLISRNVPGAGTETFGYDAIGRLTSHASDLGAFTVSYLGQTRQIIGRALPSPSTLATTWSYLTNIDDRRLSGITNVGLVAGQSSAYTFTTTPENFISAVSETSDTAIPSPAAPAAQNASYNLLNELTSLSGQVLTYDADGNLTFDGARSYAWDAENRLVAITYPGSPGKQTAFTYDGRGRRTAIASTRAGGGTVTTSYLWCGSRICQARNSDNVVTREYYAEGEYVAGSPAQPYYYGVDQLGTVRRVFASTSSAPPTPTTPTATRFKPQRR